MKRIICCLLLLVATRTLAAEIEEKIDVGIMEVWVKVTDRKGNAVKDIRPEEVQLLIDDHQVDLRCFDKTFVSSNNDQTESPGRKYIFFFDMYNTLPGDMEFLKNHIRRFILESFGSKDQGMVFALLPNAHLGVVQRMTSNRNALVSVIRKMRGNNSLAITMQSNEKELLYLLYPADTTSDDNPASFRGVGQRPTDTLHTAQSMARNFAAQEESRSRFTLNSFISIGQYLSGHSIAGSVALIYVSGGFPIRPGEHYFDLVQRNIDERFTAGAPDLAMVDRPRFDFQQDVRRTIGNLNRMNVTIYSLDAKGLLLNARGADRNDIQAAHGMDLLSRNYQLQDSLVHLAQETGGLAFIGGQNYQNGLAEIVRDMSEQYLLCGSLPSSKDKGKYHRIKVKVSRPEVTVRHRKGYVD
jgi:VWFA-related protein